MTIIDPRSFSFTLPYPPSVNTIWQMGRGNWYLHGKAKRYKESVRKHLAGSILFTQDKRLRMTVEVYPPDKRKRDIDNIMKLLLDALQYGGIIFDDSQVKALYIIMNEYDATPLHDYVHITISLLQEYKTLANAN